MGKSRVSIIDVLCSVAALIGYGGWAVFANYGFSVTAAWRAGCVQGIYASTSTLLLALAIRNIYFFMGSGHRGKLIAFAAGIVIIISLPTLLNTVAQTPHVIKTILPGALIGSVYVGRIQL